MKLFKLSQSGHFHFIMPVLAIAAVATIGAAYLAFTHAQTTGCANSTLQAGGTSASGVTKSPGGSGSTGTGANQSNCVGYAQQMLNGVYELNTTLPAGLNNDPAYVTNLHSQLLTKSGEFGVVTKTYDAPTTSQVKLFQTWVQGRLEVKSGTKTSVLSVPESGAIDTNTWQALCYYAINYYGGNYAPTNTPVGVVHHSDPRWIAHSYLRAGVSGGKAAGCLQFAQTTTEIPNWHLSSSVSISSHVDNTVRFAGSITNSGPTRTATFVYGPRYFYSTTANPTRASGKAFAGEVEPIANEGALLWNGRSVSSSWTVTANPSKGTYICATMAFDPAASNGTRNGRSAPVCVTVVRPVATTGTGTGTGGTGTTPTAPSSSCTLEKDYLAVSVNTQSNFTADGIYCSYGSSGHAAPYAAGFPASVQTKPSNWVSECSSVNDAFNSFTEGLAQSVSTSSSEYKAMSSAVFALMDRQYPACT
ncbi:MAG TPA: hypothetical protein VMB52_05845 [Verrucomicrobiae bacterium]|nr:hypothetical protein [Verrucomicrobiae bacterium]